MQSLWFRSAASTCSCRCISCVRTSSNVAANRPAAAASRRRLLLGNSLTMFYSSIFVSAMMLDARSKGKRRQEREKQIEAVKAEVERLQEEEKRLLESLGRRRRPPPTLTRPTRRQYTTIANPSAEYDRYRDAASRISRDRDDAAARDEPLDTTPMFDYEEAPNSEEQERLGLQHREDIHPIRLRAIQFLGMKILGLQLLLRPSIAHSYGATKKAYSYDQGSALQNLKVDELLEQLNDMRKRCYQIKADPEAFYGDICADVNLANHALLERQRDAMTYDLLRVFKNFEHDSISLDSVILRTADLLLSAKEPLSPRAVEMLISYYSRFRLNDVVKMVMESLFSNGFLLTIPIIITSLNWFNKTKDLSGFDRFLYLLQVPNHFVNMQTRWHSMTIGGVEVPVPPNSTPNPYILNALIACALQFDQPQKADAWLDALRATGFNDTIPTLGAYLRYYSFKADWRKGRQILMRVIYYLLSSNSHPFHEIERIILYMIVLCECCGKREIAHELIMAAVSSGLESYTLNAEEKRPALLWAAQQWRDARMYSMDGFENLSRGEKYVEFARKVEPVIRRAAEQFIPDDDLTMQRMRLEESFNMKYYKMVSDGRTKRSIRQAASEGQEPLRSELETTKAELRKLQGMVTLQSEMIARLENVVSLRDKIPYYEAKHREQENKAPSRQSFQGTWTNVSGPNSLTMAGRGSRPFSAAKRKSTDARQGQGKEQIQDGYNQHPVHVVEPE